jgi:hypothetical protein
LESHLRHSDHKVHEQNNNEPDGHQLYSSFYFDVCYSETQRSKIFRLKEKYNQLTGRDYEQAMIEYSPEFEHPGRMEMTLFHTRDFR